MTITNNLDRLGHWVSYDTGTGTTSTGTKY